LNGLGSTLERHGALSLDYVFRENEQIPLFIDANPRLVEPMNGVFGGVNLADILVRVSTGRPVATEQRVAREERTHILLMALLSAAAIKKRRLDVIRELLSAIKGHGLYSKSREELLPVEIDLGSNSIFSIRTSFRCPTNHLSLLTTARPDAKSAQVWPSDVKPDRTTGISSGKKP
jgi:hypothetical protein